MRSYKLPKGDLVAPLRAWTPLNPVILLHSILLCAVRKLVNEDISAEHCGRGADLLVTINVCGGDCRSPRHPFSPPSRDPGRQTPIRNHLGSPPALRRGPVASRGRQVSTVASVTSDRLASPQACPSIVLLWALPAPRAVRPRRMRV